MVMQISSSTLSPALATPTRSPAQRDAFKALAQTLKSGDLDGAKQAYAAIVRNAPDGATWNSQSPFAQLGRQLVAGDMTGAQSTFTDMVNGQIQHRDRGAPVVPPVTPPTGSSTGGTAGRLLNEVA
jgi:TolA-binding protein